MSDEIKNLHDTMSRDWEQMKSFLTRTDADAKAAVERVNSAIEATEAKMAEEKKAREALELKLARMEQLEQAAQSKDGPSAEEKAFDRYVRKGERGMSDAELKTLATDNDTEGGFMVPAPMRGRLIELLREASPVRAEVSVETISSGNAWEAPKESSDDFSVGKVGERDARSQTNNGKLAMERIPVHEFYANPFVTQTMLDDAGFDVEGWVAQRMTSRRAVLEGGYHINGTGEGEPEGLLTNADISYVAGGDGSAITADGLIDLTFGLPEPYARNAVFLMKRATTGKIRKLRTSTTSEFLWSPGINGGTAPTILGYRYVECIDMPAVTGNAYPVIFGDLKRAYKIVDRKGISLIRDTLTSKPFIEMYFTWRTGGQVVLAEAVRKLKIAVS